MHDRNRTWTRYLPSFIRSRIEGRHYLQNVIANTGWLFAENIMRMAISLIVGVWLTRYLGPERFGILSYATALVSIFSTIAILGLDGIAVRNIVRDPARKNEILGTTFVLKFIGGIVAYSIAMITITLLRPDDFLSRCVVGIVAAGSILQAFSVIELWFQSQVQSRYAVYAKSAAFLAIVSVKILLIVIEAPLVAFAWAILAEMAASSAALLATYFICGLQLKSWRVSGTVAKELLGDSWPLILSDLVILIYMKFDKVMIGEIAGDTELGIYSVAVLLAEVWCFIPMAVTSSVFPSVIEAREGGNDELFYRRLQQLYSLMVFLAYIIAIPTTLLAGWVVPLLFGKAYGDASNMLIGLIWAGVFMNLAYARSHYLTVMNWTRLHFITDFLGCLLNLTLNLILIPRYGGMGAVISSIVSYWFAVHGVNFMFKPLHRTGFMITRSILCPKFW